MEKKMNRFRRAWLAACMSLALTDVACGRRSEAPRPALDLSYLPSDVMLVAYADTVRLKESPLYRAWESRAPGEKNRLAEAKTFLQRLGVDTEKDLDGVLVACAPSADSAEWMALLRGRFDVERIGKGLEDPSARMAKESYRQWSIYNLVLVPDLGDLSVALVDSSALALGKSDTLRRMLDAREKPEISLQSKGLMKRLVPRLDGRAQIWAMLDGRALIKGFKDSKEKIPGAVEIPDLGNLSSVVSASLSASLGEDLSLRLEIGSDSSRHAQSLADGLKGVLGFARLGGAAKEKDLGAVLDGIRVDGSGESVVLRAEVPGEVALRLEKKWEEPSR